MATDTLNPAASRDARVAFPVWVSFTGDRFLIKEFTADLSVRGIFLVTDHMVDPLTRGTLTFRISPWEKPFTVEAEVVRTVPPGGDAEPGLGIQFLNLGNREKKKLERLVGGIRDGSVMQSIRRAVHEEGVTMSEELRQRPTDQKVILAVGARGDEISALIRDGNPIVMRRLLDNPALSIAHVRSILQDTRTPTTFLTTLRKHRRWTYDDQVRELYCKHPNTPVHDALDQLRKLPFNRLRLLERDMNLRPRLREAAQDILRRRSHGRT